VNRLAALCRSRGFPVVWTYVAYLPSVEDCGVWGTRTDTPDSLQNIAIGSERHQFDPRCTIQPEDLEFTKRMPSAFFETPLKSWLQWKSVHHPILSMPDENHHPLHRFVLHR